MRVVEVFFSPTGGTRRAADVVAGALARNLDLSSPVSDDLTVSLEPMFDTTYTQISGTQPAFGFNLNIRF